MSLEISTQKNVCRLIDLGLIDYPVAYARQKQAVEEIIAGGGHQLFLCEHPSTVTLGRMTKKESLLFSKDDLQRRGIEVCSVDRGGDVTLHNPGQLVVYPVFNLNCFGRDLKKYLEGLEEVAIDLLSRFDILALSISEKRGVWVGNRKIASIGIGVKKWVSFHGVGMNVSNDLSQFSVMKPCGLDVQMTSLESITQKRVLMSDVKEKMAESFKKVFHLTFEQ